MVKERINGIQDSSFELFQSKEQEKIKIKNMNRDQGT